MINRMVGGDTLGVTNFGSALYPNPNPNPNPWIIGSLDQTFVKVPIP